MKIVYEHVSYFTLHALFLFKIVKTYLLDYSNAFVKLYVIMFSKLS